MKKILAIYASIYLSFQSLFAEEQNVGDQLLNHNKLTTVHVVLSIILIGIILYLILQDRRLKKLEDRLNK